MSLAHYDVVIIGGGMVGATLANLLAQAGLQIAVVEQELNTAAPLSTDAEYSLRVSAINWASQQILQQIGVWTSIEAIRLSPYRKIYVWDERSQAHIEFTAEKIAQAQLGYIIENAVIQQALLAKMQADARIELYVGQSLQQLSILTEQAELILTGGKKLTASLVIGADGIHSKVRELAGIALAYKDYQHTAIIATVRCEKTHQQTAWQSFLPEGVLAFLPLADPRTCSIVWSCNKEQAERLLRLDELGFRVALQDIAAKYLGKIEWLSERLAFPLAMRHAHYYAVPRVALVGDAAHTIHPLAGQGLNLGLADAAYLAKVLKAVSQAKRDIGLLTNLRAYERWRKKENLIMIVAMQAFKDLFGSVSPLLIWLRGWGLNSVDRLAWLKRFLIRQAMGFNNE